MPFICFKGTSFLVVVYVFRLASTMNIWSCLLRVLSRGTGPHWITGVGRGVYKDGGKIQNTCRHIVCLTCTCCMLACAYILYNYTDLYSSI